MILAVRFECVRTIPMEKASPDVNMRHTDLILEGQIRQLVNLNYSYRDIKRNLKSQGINASNGLITNVKKRMNDQEDKENPNPVKKRKISESKLTALKQWTDPSNSNPPTQRFMASKLHLSPSTVNHYVNEKLGRKLRKKPKCHRLTEKNIQNRKEKSPLFIKYLKQLKKIVTSDEAMFYMQMANGVRDSQYVDRIDKNPHLEARENVERYSPHVMVWAGVSYDHKSSIIFVEEGAKMNAKTYIRTILKPFIKKDAKRMFPKGDYWFHQDSAPSHVAKETREWAENNGLKLIPKEHWMAKSPDAAPMDYSIWNQLKHMVKQCQVSDMKSFKRAIRSCWKKMPQEYIQKVLKSWSKRVGMMIENEGRHIENFRA